MQITKSFRVNHRNSYDHEFFSVTMSHEDIGLKAPTTIEEARTAYTQLSMQVEALKLIEAVKIGLIHSNQIHENLKPWLPHVPG